MGMSATNAEFVFKALTIGAVLVISFAASLFVQSVVQDRIAYQTEALEAQSGNTSSVLIHGKLPGFDEDGVSVYRPVDRVTKYAIVFIVLTFLALFLTEVMYELRLHPMQYLLVGLGLAEFYLLLIALMEHIGFSLAYVVAAVAIILLISSYSRFVLQTKKGGALIATLLTIAYAYLFVILHLDTYALLSGAILLFVVLSAIMFITRNLNWYEAFSYAKKVE